MRRIITVAAFIVLTGFTSNQDGVRLSYLDACAKSAAQLATLTKGRVTADEYCPCLFDNTMSRVDGEYARFAHRLLYITAGVYPHAEGGFATYMTHIRDLTRSRPDGQQAFDHAVSALRQAKNICMKRS